MELVLLLNTDVSLSPDYFEHLFPYFDLPDTFGVSGRFIGLNDEKIQDNIRNDLKSINISNLEEQVEKKNKNIEVIDYKKLSLNKLKSIVLEKGLVTDSSKLKKHELLKLLLNNE